MAAVRTGESLADLLNEMGSARSHQYGNQMFAGAVDGLLSIFLQLRDAGTTFSSDFDPTATEFVQAPSERIVGDLQLGLNGGDVKGLNRRLGLLVGAVGPCRNRLRFEGAATGTYAIRAEPADAPAAAAVTLAVPLPAVASYRKTETVIHKDQTGKIIGSTSTETNV